VADISEVAIYNMALSAIGNQETVASTDEASPAAQTCSIWYTMTRNRVFQAAPWSDLKGTFRLALKSTRDDTKQWQVTDPTPGFTYAYNLTDYSNFGISTMADNKRTLMAHTAQAILIYTKLVADPSLWNAGLLDAVVFALAAQIVKPITGKTTDIPGFLQIAKSKINSSLMAEANQSYLIVQPPNPEWIAARGSAYDTPYAPFIFPAADFVVSGFQNVT
jgi:hypothetical protein